VVCDKPIRVLVAEDMQILRDTITELMTLRSDFEVVAAVAKGSDLVVAAGRARPDVALFDVNLPDIGGLELVSELRGRAPMCRLLAYTAVERPGVVWEALRAGVHGFLPKDVSFAQLTEAVRKVHLGERVFDTKLLSEALEQGDNPLTPKERTVLHLTALGSSVDQIAGNLHLAQGTVRNHLAHVITKLSARNRIDAVRIADLRGWI
jgi:two-component system response regulator DesR